MYKLWKPCQIQSPKELLFYLSKVSINTLTSHQPPLIYFLYFSPLNLNFVFNASLFPPSSFLLGLLLLQWSKADIILIVAGHEDSSLHLCHTNWSRSLFMPYKYWHTNTDIWSDAFDLSELNVLVIFAWPNQCQMYQ